MKDYKTHHMVAYEKPQSRGFQSIEVLSFLKGKKWDEIALAYVNAVRPSCIRVTTGMCTLDGRTWRVTVIVDENDIIKKITQEVEVGLPEGISHGEHLSYALQFGIDSPEEKWWRYDPENPTTMTSYIFGAMVKHLKNGESVYFPGHENIPVPDDLSKKFKQFTSD